MAKKNKSEIVKSSTNNEYLLFKYRDRYYIADNTGDVQHILRTPGGEIVSTLYYPLAERLFEDVQKYGTECMSVESILPWHYTLCENFVKMEHKEIEAMLESCFIQKPDWTYECCDDEAWNDIFGNQIERVVEIRKWLSKCTHMQMTAACCIGNAYHSINIAFVLASIMENYTNKERKKQFKLLADIISKNSLYGPILGIIKNFNNFNLYYGIHLEEEGSIINNSAFESYVKRNECIFEITVEMLIGRNYYHYRNGEKDREQFSLNHDLSSFLTDDDEGEENYDFDKEYDDDVDGGLAEYIPNECWLKKISSVDDGENYYLIAIEMKDGKITDITVLFDEVSRMDCGMFFIPGMDMPRNHSYSEIDIEDYKAIKNEIEALKKGRYISDNFSFVGKKLPDEIIKKDKYNDYDTRYMICLQSVYRMAYMDLFINTDEKGIIKDFDYFTYQSTGNGYGDMFTRPQELYGKNEEAIDMLLYIIDKYTDEEYTKNFGEKTMAKKNRNHCSRPFEHQLISYEELSNILNINFLF